LRAVFFVCPRHNRRAEARMTSKKASDYKVKNTFVEFGGARDPADDEFLRGSRSKSDIVGKVSSPLIIARSPTGSPSLLPVDEVAHSSLGLEFELLEESADPSAYEAIDALVGESRERAPSAVLESDEPAYVVPTTPSPFLHAAAFPPGACGMPPFSFGEGGYMGLPPAFGDGTGNGCDGLGFTMEGMDGQWPQGMPFMPGMYDPNFNPYMNPWMGQMNMEGLGLEGMQGMMGAGCQWPDGSGMLDGTDVQVPTQDGGSAAPKHEVVQAVIENEASRGKEGRAEQREFEKEEKRERRHNQQAAEEGTGSPNRKERTGPAANGLKPAEDIGKDIVGPFTTVMLRNIPNKYSREMLIAQLNQDYSGMYDFMYLPIDFKNKCNVGYGFINFRTQDTCEYFCKQFHGVDVRKCLPGLNSNKIVEVTPARVQGYTENVRRLRNSPVMNQLIDNPEWMPLVFDADGNEKPFPHPEQSLPPIKARGRAR